MRLRTFSLLCVILILTSCASGYKRGENYRERKPFKKSVALQQIHDKNFSVIRTDMAFKGLTLGAPILIRAFKTEMELEVWVKHTYKDEYILYKTYPICKKSGELGPKQAEGDHQTPEGFYSVTEDRLNPNSKYFLSFDIGYPNEYDRSYGRHGSALMIHGNCVSVGCLAMTDANIGDIYLIVEESLKRNGGEIPVQIYPFRMTKENMMARVASPWTPFWQNLKIGYDYFETYHIPPRVSVMDGHYVFGNITTTN